MTRQDQSDSQLTSDDGIGRGDSGDDILHDPLRQLPGDALDLELGGTVRGHLVQPLDMVRIVCI